MSQRLDNRFVGSTKVEEDWKESRYQVGTPNMDKDKGDDSSNGMELSQSRMCWNSIEEGDRTTTKFPPIGEHGG